MLGIMRKHKKSLFIKGIFILIVLSFIGTIFLIWGQGDEGLQSSDYALKINGQKIPYEQYLASYNKIRESIQQIYGQPVTPELEKQFGLKKLAMENLITTVLMQQEAKQMGIKVSDEELASEIAKIPYFLKNGTFDKKQYEEVLAMNRLSPRSFEDAQRKELTIFKARKQIADKVSVSDQDALDEYKKRHDQVNLQFALITPEDLRSAVSATDKELSAYLQQHEKEFRTREEISIAYVVLPAAKMIPKVTVTSEEMQTYYQKNIDRYQEKGEILPFEAVKDRVKKDSLTFKAAKQAYEAAAVALNANMKTADLSAVAAQLGVPVSETGLFTANNPPASLAGEQNLVSKAFFLKQGELGGPLESEKGVYVFKIKTRNPSIVPPLAQIKAAVTDRYVKEKSVELAAKKALDVQSKLKKGEKVDSLRETGLFSYSAKGEIPQIGTAPEIMETAFSLNSTSATPASPTQINGRWYAIRLKNRVQGDMSKFTSEKSAIIQELLPRKQQHALEKWLKDLRSSAKIVINPALDAE